MWVCVCVCTVAYHVMTHMRIFCYIDEGYKMSLDAFLSSLFYSIFDSSTFCRITQATKRIWESVNRCGKNSFSYFAVVSHDIA